MNYLSDSWTFFIHSVNFLNLIFIIFILFFERKEPGRRMGWLLALVFVPIVGMIFYILFSGHFFTHNKKMQIARKFVDDALKPWLDSQYVYLKKHIAELKETEVRYFMRLVDMNIVYASSVLTWTDSLKIYCWGKDKFKDMCIDLENAQKSIHLEYFIFRNDTIGKKILEILCRKAHEGVDVKLMYDDLGSFSVPSSFFAPLNAAGGEVHPFFPIRSIFPVSVNFRNHRKIAIIDSQIGYMGGINIGDEYLNQKRRGKKVLWRDTSVRMTGPSVLSLQLVFLTDWVSVTNKFKNIKTVEDVASFYPLSDFNMLNKQIAETNLSIFADANGTNRKIPTQILYSGPDELDKAEIRDAMIRMIMSARKSVFIQSPYFTPDETFFNTLRIASVSGVDVRIMVPGVWDKIYVKAAAVPYIRGLIDVGAKFYAYPGFIHSKTLVIDNRIVTIGSTNIDNRSFSLHFEVNSFFYDKKIATTYAKLFLKDQSKSKELTAEWFNSRFVLLRAWWGFCNLFSPLM